MFKFTILDGHGALVLSATWPGAPSDDEVWDVISDSGKFPRRADVQAAVNGIIQLRDQAPSTQAEVEIMNGLQLHYVKAVHE